MRYFKFAKTLSKSMILVEISDNPLAIENSNQIVLSEEELKNYKTDDYFICQIRKGNYLQNDKKVKTGKAFLKHFNNN